MVEDGVGLETLPNLARIVVIGSSGSGKTTVAQKLADVLQVPHIELDVLHWGPNWAPIEKEKFRAAVEQRISWQRWVIDGNYSSVRDIVWSRATTVLWLNYAFPVVFWRVFWRTMRRVFQRQELFAGNRESFRMTFLSRESLLWWVITTYRRRKRTYRAMFDNGVYPNIRLIEFQKPRQTESFFELLQPIKSKRG